MGLQGLVGGGAGKIGPQVWQMKAQTPPFPQLVSWAIWQLSKKSGHL